MRIVFMGTPEFAVPSLQILINNGYKPVAVATGPDKQRGRGRKWSPTAIKTVAIENDIPVLQPHSVKDPSFADEIKALSPDLIVVVAFRILPPEVFEAAKLGSFNLHGSLLPAFRGAAPIQRALMAGASKTGVTTFFLKARVDTGNIILTREMDIGPDETAGMLHDRMMHVGADVVLETVRLVEKGNVPVSVQDDREATPAPKISRTDARIVWNADRDDVHNQIRGLSPVPGAWTMHEDVRLKILRSRIGGRSSNRQSGEIVSVENGIEIACGTGTIVALEIQREGKAKLSALEFVNGYRIDVGDKLE